MAHSRFKVYMSKNIVLQAFVANRNVGQSVVVQCCSNPGQCRKSFNSISHHTC